MKPNRFFILQLLIAGTALAAALFLTVWFFMRIPTEGTTLALDWISIRAGLENWDLTYRMENGLRYPPWSALLLLPLGQVPVGAGWGAVAFLTLMVLPLCLPRETESGKAGIFGILALTLSFPAVRTIVDGNIEFLILAGLVLLEFGLVRNNPVLLALGVLLAATKVQETWILILFLPIIAGKKWIPRKWLMAFGVMAGIGLPTMIWRGRAWLFSIVTSPYRGSIMDSSLLTTIQRMGGSLGLACLLWALVFGVTVFFVFRYVRGFSREAFGFLTAVSLLLSPYAAGNNLLIVYAVGVIPLLLARRWEGVILAVLINLPYGLLPFREWNYWHSASYWTLVLILAWALFALRLRARFLLLDTCKTTGVEYPPC
ncbi:MAG: DUF2029 domain-containing protein [Anaerolineales bacterium]|nr:DUF2029 domain-containing protein [Anaerolineales bacterium]